MEDWRNFMTCFGRYLLRGSLLHDLCSEAWSALSEGVSFALSAGARPFLRRHLGRVLVVR